MKTIDKKQTIQNGKSRMIDIELAVRWLYENAKDFGYAYIGHFDNEDGFREDYAAFRYESRELIQEFRKAMGR